jgi:hypothetical protein
MKGAAMQTQLQPTPAVPWWRVGTMWLVVGGLGVVVAGSFALAVTAVSGADIVVTESMPTGRPAGTQAITPAMQGRNHAATPPLVSR